MPETKPDPSDCSESTRQIDLRQWAISQRLGLTLWSRSNEQVQLTKPRAQPIKASYAPEPGPERPSDLPNQKADLPERTLSEHPTTLSADRDSSPISAANSTHSNELSLDQSEHFDPNDAFAQAIWEDFGFEDPSDNAQIFAQTFTRLAHQEPPPAVKSALNHEPADQNEPTPTSGQAATQVSWLCFACGENLALVDALNMSAEALKLLKNVSSYFGAPTQPLTFPLVSGGKLPNFFQDDKALNAYIEGRMQQLGCSSLISLGDELGAQVALNLKTQVAPSLNECLEQPQLKLALWQALSR